MKLILIVGFIFLSGCVNPETTSDHSYDKLKENLNNTYFLPKCLVFGELWSYIPNELGEIKKQERHLRCNEEIGEYFVYDREAQLFNREVDKRLELAKRMCGEIGSELSRGFCIRTDGNVLIKTPIEVHDKNVYFVVIRNEGGEN